MPLSKNINTYNDVLQVLQTARQANKPLIYTLSSPGAAVNFKSRVYYYRTLLVNAARARAGNVAGYVPTTDWDEVLVTHKKGDVSVVITFGIPPGRLTDQEGNIITPVARQSVVSAGAAEVLIAAPPQKSRNKSDPEPDFDLDELEREARQLLREQGEDEA
jgi:hypothetical protein